ncbi:hypothetical protein [Nocardioides convexus]|uniref:hypothetical protein n=1 Tax=Nocardioides convexus TaxID=2712224 RepID=UPI0031015559
MRFLAGFARHLSAARRRAAAQGREFLLTGDLNVAHTRLDVANWRRSNQVEGFLPEERAWLDAQAHPAHAGRRGPSAAPGHRGAVLLVEPGSARPTPRTPAGGSTTTWRPRRWRARPGWRWWTASTTECASATTPPWWSTTIRTRYRNIRVDSRNDLALNRAP